MVAVHKNSTAPTRRSTTARRPHIAAAPAEQPEFIEGVRLFADMLEVAVRIDEEGSDEAELRAGYRGAGVAQNVFARPFFEQLVARPAVAPGFLAALSSHLRACGASGDSVESLRSVTYEDCHGGPGVVYLAGEDPLQVACRGIQERLRGLLALTFPREEVQEGVETALEAVQRARETIVAAEARAALAEARKHVHEARQDHEVTGVQYVPKSGFEELAAGLLEVHRAINAVIGGTTWEDRQGKPRSALGALLDKLGRYIDVAEGIDRVHCSEALGSLYDFDRETKVGASGAVVVKAEVAEERGDDESALALLPKIRDALRADLVKIDETDGRWLHLSTCLQLVDQFLGAADGLEVRR